MKTLVSWSSGKDSAWMVHTLRQRGVEIGALLTTINESAQRVAMHAVRVEVVQAQAAALELPLWLVPIPSPCPNEVYEEAMRVAVGHAVRVEVVQAQAAALELPLWLVPIPSPCPNEVYEEAMRIAVARAVSEGFTHAAFGDLFLDDIRKYREERLAGSGLTPLFPLFGTAEDTPALARRMIAAGLRARITCLNPKVMDRMFAGREFDEALLDELPASIDPCAERGEFHTCAYDGPMFNRGVPVETGITVERDGYMFTDLTICNQLSNYQITR